MPGKVVFDLDDFREDTNALDLLFRMKARWPKFKVTLFTIPTKCSPRFLQEIKQISWIEMAMHGWEHLPLEFDKMSKNDTLKYLSIAESWNVFEKGFKGPHWRTSQGTLDALQERGWWVAGNADPNSRPNGERFPEGLPVYFANGDLITNKGDRYGNFHREHGHIGALDCVNDLRQIWLLLQQRFSEDTEWFTCGDVIRQFYGEQPKT